MYNVKSYAVYKFKQREDIMTALTVVIIAVAAALVAGFIAFICGFFYRKSVSEKQIGSANDEARRIINEAIKTKKRFSKLRNSYIKRGPNRSAR